MADKKTKIRVRVPATTSNLGPGFDVLGMALKLYNELELTCEPGWGEVRVDITGEGAETLPRSSRNLVVRSFRALIPKRLPRHNLRFRMVNRIPLCRGLGSSAAARLAGLLAATALKSGKPPFGQAVTKACAMEGHPDNAVPAFFGGLCGSVVERGNIEYFRLKPPRGLTAALCIPAIEVSTEKARRLMPKRVTLADAVFTSSRLALLVAAMTQGRLELLRTAMRDVLHQPYRKRLVPGMDAAIAAAERAGALGAALSGSGPTVLAFAGGERAGRRAAEAMCRAFARRGMASRALVLGVDNAGARVRASR
ncbi:MAG: homoserine kinase [Elusimicrobiota bacterium]